jgi:hypothetical protein
MTLVYQAYGVTDVMRQTTFSIVTLLGQLKESKALRVVVYTDKPEFFYDFFKGESRIHFEVVSLEQIKKWRGAIDFVHRVKIEILKDASNKFSGPLFYADGDTYFLESPRALFMQVSDQISLMHIPESALDKGKDPISKKMNRFVKKNVFKVDSKDVKIESSTVMWNAGVIGVSESNKKFFDQIVQLTDEMHSRYPKHVNEQLAVSFVLQKNTRVLAANEVIYHYWNQKDEYQRAIDVFLAKNNTLAAAIGSLKLFQYPAPPKRKARGIEKIFGFFKTAF